MTKLRTVYFDNSFLQNVKNSKLDLFNIEHWPTCDYKRFIQDTVLCEFLGNWWQCESHRKRLAEFLEQHNIHVLREDKVVIGEYLCGPDKYQLAINNETMELSVNIIKFLKGKHLDQAEKESKYQENRNKRKEGSESSWAVIKKSDGERENIAYEEIFYKARKLMTNQENTCAYVQKILQKIEKDYNHPEPHFHKQKIKKFEDIQQDLPTFYNLFIWQAFCDQLTELKTKNIKTKKGQEFFDITFELEQIKLDKNTFADMRTAIPFLNYMDRFITSDKGQADLLKYLYPNYKEKIELIKLERQQ